MTAQEFLAGLTGNDSDLRLVQGKLWAFDDVSRRASKRAKDRADLIRICETHPRIVSLIPPGLIPEVDDLHAT